MTGTAKLSVRGLVKYYGQNLVLDRVDLDVMPGETVCLIGASGSGKSTLLRCLNRLVEPDYGTIALDGVPINDASFGRTGLQRRIGVVFQSYNLFPHMRVIDNLTLAPRRVHGVPRAQAEASAQAVLDRLGMARFARSYPEQLSGGQQQRVAIARALASRPDVLLLDEVTAALDPALVGEVLAVIADLRAQGQTMVIVTHEMAFARAVADRVCFLAQGRIVEQGPPAELFGAPAHPLTRAFLDRILAPAGRPA
jgi:polar amino acid transport system ATP-binding protein